MDFSLPPEIETLRLKVRAFVPSTCCRSRWTAPITMLTRTSASTCWHPCVRRRRRKACGPADAEGARRAGLPMVGWAAFYEEANRSIFGPLAFNCCAPDDGNMNVLNKVLKTDAQKDQWLQPIIDGKIRSSFVMTEPHPGSGSDPAA